MNRVRLLPLLLAALSGLLLGSLPLSSAQAAPPEIEVSAPLLPLARWGGWVPVHVDIRTTEPVELTVDAHFLGGEPGTGTSRSLKLPRGAQRRVVLVVPVSGWAQELIVRVEGRRGVIHAASKLSLGTGSAALDSFHVAVVGEEPLGWPLVATATRLPVPGHPSISNQAERPVRVENLMPSDLPVHWFGYSPVDVLVWRRPDPSGLSPEQQAALRGWVAVGHSVASFVVSVIDGKPKTSIDLVVVESQDASAPSTVKVNV